MHNRASAEMSCKYRPAEVIRLLPLIMFICVTFLLVRMHGYSLPLSSLPYMADDTVLYDCFSHIKMVWIIISSGFAALLLSYYVLTGKRSLRRSFLYVPMAAYAFFVVLAYFLSDYKIFALWGSYERSEGTIVHLCYLFMMFYAMNIIDDGGDISIIVNSLFAAVTVACLIGLSQFAGHDFYDTALGKWLLLGGMDGDISYNSGSRRVYQSVYNSNYVGFYLSIVIPVIVGRIADSVQKMRHKLNGMRNDILYLTWLAGLLMLCIINVWGAGSEGSVPGIVSGSAAVVLVRTGNKRVCAAFAAVSALLAIAVLSGMLGSGYSPFTEADTGRADIEYIRTYDNTIEIMINDEKLVTKYDPAEGEFVLTDGSGDLLDTFLLPENEYRYEFESRPLNGAISFTPLYVDGNMYAIFETGDEMWRFICTGDGVKYLNSAGKLESLDKAEHAGIIRNYGFGNGRGYIWDTAIPLIRKYLFAGAGADTFMLIFPQNDYAVRYSCGLSTGCVYDKPHNMYIQLALSFGLTGLAAFITIIVMAYAGFIRGYCHGQRNDQERCGFYPVACILIGAAAFLVSALVNDSSVQVSPMFFGLLGCACAPRFR